MKKFLLTALAIIMSLSMFACTNDNGENNGEENNEVNDTPVYTITDATELLNKVWAAYADDQKFAAGGGDANNMNMEGPGKYDISDALGLDSIAGYPEANIASIDDAATLMHMMNVNTFTGAAYRLVNVDDAATVAEALKTNILARQWMCGFPEKLVVISVENYLVSAFGNGEIIDTFKANLQSVYPEAEVLVEEPIV